MASATSKTILIVFIHGFKGDDTTFSSFPSHLSTLMSTRLALLASASRPPNTSSPAPTGDQSPAPTITSRLFPAFQTRGALSSAVQRFRAWLLEQVIDAEVARGTTSPTVDPGVGVVVIGHSMGGIVAAEAVLEIAAESSAAVPVSPDHAVGGGTAAEVRNAPLFPRILGVLAFDTPYLGIAPGVIRYGVEERWTQGRGMFENAMGIWEATKKSNQAGGPRGAGAVASSETTGATPASAPARSGAEAGAASTAKSGGTSKWTWGRAALIAGGAAATLAGAGAAAYAGREQIAQGWTVGRERLTSGWNWVGSHLQFVGTLSRQAELKARLDGLIGFCEGHGWPRREAALPEGQDHDVAAAAMERDKTRDNPDDTSLGLWTIDEERGRRRTSSGGDDPRHGRPGFAVLFTSLAEKGSSDRSSALDAERTFCRLPQRGIGRGDLSVPGSLLRSSPLSASSPLSKTLGANLGTYWIRAVNSKASNEIEAHVEMFLPDRNPNYERMTLVSAEILAGWVPQDWYRSL